MAAALFATASPQLSVAQSMTLPGKFSVGSSGSATYNIPIAVPPGTAGLAPSLSVEYDSHAGNGLLGLGWSLGGLPSIGRCARTTAQDGTLGGINYDANDRFCMDGQRLVVISGTYGADGAQYRTEVETFSEIISHGTAGNGPAWFEVHTKSGQIVEFGHTVDSLVLAQGTSTARSWALDKVSDTKGNYFTVTYTNDTINGQAYPIEIDYSGNVAASLSPNNKVQFVYATRPDIIPQYQAGSVSQTTLRLTDVKAFSATNLVADYRLSYQQSGPSNRSRLTSITVCDGASACLPATTVGWTNPTAGFGGAPVWNSQYGPDSGWNDDNVYPRMLIDVNGDGLPDVVGFGASGVVVSLNTGTSFGTAQLWNSCFGTNCGWSDNNTYPRMLIDVNGDGLPDVVGFGANGVNVALNTGTSFGPAQVWNSCFGTNCGWSDNNTYPRMLIDLNGDGLPDVVGFASNGVNVALNTGTSFAAAQLWVAGYVPSSGGWTDNNTYPRMLVDVNGDGLPDVVGFAAGGVYVSLNTGTSFAPGQPWITAYGTTSGGWTDNTTYPRMLVDVNGDGLPDVVGFSAGGVYVSLNTGTSFAPGQLWIAAYGTNAGGWPDNNTNPRMLIDVNGDGLPDVVGFANTGAYVSLNTGTSFGPMQQWSSAWGTNAGWPDNSSTPRTLIDVKGSGFAGIVGFASGGVFVAPNTANGASDLVSSVTTGLGTTTTITYAAATNNSVVTKGSGTVFPTLDLAWPLYVVSRVDTSNGVGGLYSSGYAYSGGRIDTRGRGFLGFGRMMANDLQSGITDVTNYRQDFPFLALVSSTTRTIGTQTLAQSTNTYQLSNVNGTTTISPSSAPYQVSLSQNVSTGSDLDGSALPAVTTTNQYDALGNATQIVVSTSDGYSKTTNNTFTNDTTNWLLGRLTGSTVTAQAPQQLGQYCTLPWGGTINNGQSVTAYSAASPASGQTCSAIAQTRTCTNGTLGGSFTQQSCSPPCTLPWGGTISLGQSVTAYSVSGVPAPQLCSSVAETRSCGAGGALSGSFTKQSCAVIQPKHIYLTSGTSWTVPADWNSGNNTIEVIGGGGGGGGSGLNPNNGGGSAGGGGAYSKVSNLSLTPNSNIIIQVGAGGGGGWQNSAPGAGGDTWFNGASLATSSCGAKGGVPGSYVNTTGSGGAAGAGIGTTRFSGGNGGSGGPAGGNVGGGGGGGGGAAGPGGNGGAGNSGSSGVSGGGSSAGGGLGGTGGAAAGGAGKNGTDMGTAGSGGGGGGNSGAGNPGSGGTPGGAAGSYGGGGGGGGGQYSGGPSVGVGGSGARGIIVITYTPSS